MKGVLLSIIRGPVCLLDLGHGIGPQDLRHAASPPLRPAVFPPRHTPRRRCGPGRRHRARRALRRGGRAAPAVPGQRLLDAERAATPPSPPRVRPAGRAAEPRPRSARWTSGRDVFAPAAAHLSLGVDPSRRSASSVGRLAGLRSLAGAGSPDLPGRRGRVRRSLRQPDHQHPRRGLGRTGPGRPVRLTVGEREVVRWVRTDGEAVLGTLVALTSSIGTLEIAVVHGSAARQLGNGGRHARALTSRKPKEIRNRDTK